MLDGHFCAGHWSQVRSNTLAWGRPAFQPPTAKAPRTWKELKRSSYQIQIRMPEATLFMTRKSLCQHRSVLSTLRQRISLVFHHDCWTHVHTGAGSHCDQCTLLFILFFKQHSFCFTSFAASTSMSVERTWRGQDKAQLSLNNPTQGWPKQCTRVLHLV